MEDLKSGSPQTHLSGLWVRGHAQARCLAIPSSGQSLPKFLRDKRHERVEEAEPRIQTRVEGTTSYGLRRLVAAIDDRLHILLRGEKARRMNT